MVKATKTARDAEYFLALQTQTGWGRVLDRFGAWIGICDGWLTLDVGCGPGLLPGLLSQKGARAFGIDLAPKMFSPTQLHPDLALANVFHLPFSSLSFDLITASNLLFLLPEPGVALQEMTRLVKINGKIALLNPSEILTVSAASKLADQRGLDGFARETLLNWAARAEANYRWTKDDLISLFEGAGLTLDKTETIMGPGFARLALGVRK